MFRFKLTSSTALVNIKNNQSKLPPDDSELEPELEELELELELLELELELEELDEPELEELEELELDWPHEEGFSGISSVKVCCPGATRIGSSSCVL